MSDTSPDVDYEQQVRDLHARAAAKFPVGCRIHVMVLLSVAGPGNTEIKYIVCGTQYEPNHITFDGDNLSGADEALNAAWANYMHKLAMAMVPPVTVEELAAVRAMRSGRVADHA